MIPGLSDVLNAGGGEAGADDAQRRIKRMIFITDSMTSYELDSDGTCFLEFGSVEKEGANGKMEIVQEPTGLSWRVRRVAKGSGTSVREVEDLLCQYKMMANMAKSAGGKNGWYVATYWSLAICSLLVLPCRTSNRMQQMQKIQQAVGTPKGPNGMPTREQIAAAQVLIFSEEAENSIELLFTQAGVFLNSALCHLACSKKCGKVWAVAGCRK